MPDGSSSAAPVTNPGPSSRNKIFSRLAGDFLISFSEEFMARSSNKAVQISRFFYALQSTLPISLDEADLALQFGQHMGDPRVRMQEVKLE
jgi:hypothetical protein